MPTHRSAGRRTSPQLAERLAVSTALRAVVLRSRAVRKHCLMRIVSDPILGEVDLSATETELTRLAGLVAAGEGSLTCESEPVESNALTAVEVIQTTDAGVRLHVDAARRVLVISGNPAARAILADNLNSMAQMEDGGHLHVDYFPDHPYLAAGSVPLVVNSPHGGMPTR
jgi:hypothetical protein